MITVLIDGGVSDHAAAVAADMEIPEAVFDRCQGCGRFRLRIIPQRVVMLEL